MAKLTRIHKKVCEIFNVDPQNTTPKGWMLSPKECPFCGKPDRHFGIKLNYKRSGKYKNHLVYNCFKCQEHGADFLLFKKLDMLSFIQDGDFIKQDKIQLENRIKAHREEVKSGVDLTTLTKIKPLGYKRVFDDPYLNSRGFEPWQYELYNVGRTRLVNKLKDYIIILVEENGENKGYLARHKWDKEKIKAHEKKTGKTIIRYANEGGVDFEKLLLGIGEVVEGTHTVILVEGAFDKFNVDKQLSLNESDDIKCCCTFGKKMSAAQIEKLRLKGVENIFLLYDNDAVNESKRYSDDLMSAFNKVKVCFIRSDNNRDAGDFDFEELMDILETAQDPINFQMSKLQKRNL